jgi:hypothetical protein
MTIEISKFDWIECDNGKKYEVIPALHLEFPIALIREAKVANYVPENYLNDYFKMNEPICIGEDDKRNPIYTKIVNVYNLWGIRKS